MGYFCTMCHAFHYRGDIYYTSNIYSSRGRNMGWKRERSIYKDHKRLGKVGKITFWRIKRFNKKLSGGL